jgi:hypothetical protein
LKRKEKTEKKEVNGVMIRRNATQEPFVRLSSTPFPRGSLILLKKN